MKSIRAEPLRGAHSTGALPVPPATPVPHGIAGRWHLGDVSPSSSQQPAENILVLAAGEGLHARELATEMSCHPPARSLLSSDTGTEQSPAPRRGEIPPISPGPAEPPKRMHQETTQDPSPPRSSPRSREAAASSRLTSCMASLAATRGWCPAHAQAVRPQPRPVPARLSSLKLNADSLRRVGGRNAGSEGTAPAGRPPKDPRDVGTAPRTDDFHGVSPLSAPLLGMESCPEPPPSQTRRLQTQGAGIEVGDPLDQAMARATG